jgi:hypothetical protein
VLKKGAYRGRSRAKGVDYDPLSDARMRALEDAA